ncbi:MAG: maleylpyruvate isomerase N-terminal domain-containing protein [Actinomycetota bacterium]
MARVTILGTLAAECERISSCLLPLTDDDFARPTRCGEWNVKELLAHLYRDIEQVAVMVAEPPAPAIDADAVSYWGMYDPVVDGRSIADRAKMRAAAHRTGHELARIWDWMWPKALDDAKREDTDRIIRTWGPGMLLQEFLRTRVVEAAVHGLDLADALGRVPWLTPAGCSMTGFPRFCSPTWWGRRRRLWSSATRSGRTSSIGITPSSGAS